MSKYDLHFLEIAKVYARLSHAKRKQVGAVIVKDNSIISDGYNGTPRGYSNECEDSNGNTHWYVLHAEANAITKTAKNTSTCDNSTLYITLSPCRDCCKLIIQSGIKRVVYVEEYRDISGITFLEDFGISCEKIS